MIQCVFKNKFYYVELSAILRQPECITDVAFIEFQTDKYWYVYMKRKEPKVFYLHCPSLENESVLHNNVIYFISPVYKIMHNDNSTVQMNTIFVTSKLVSSGHLWVKLVMWNGQCEQSYKSYKTTSCDVLFFTDTRKQKLSWKDRMYFFAQLPRSFSCVRVCVCVCVSLCFC